MTIGTMPIAAPEGYALDSNWHAERARLDSLTALYDPGTLAIVERLGLGPGWRCLDVGAGTGTLAQALAARVAPSGSVVAVDVNTRFLEPLAGPYLEPVSLDVTQQPLPASEFDLVHARLLLEHLPARDAVLASMIRATKPGGWVLIEDLDWVTAMVVDPPSEIHARVVGAIQSAFASHGYDAQYGRSLPRRLRAAGLDNVATHAQSMQVTAGREHGVPQWELLADQFAPALLARGLVSENDLAAFHQLWHDGDTICFAPLMVSCWGQVAGRRPS
jgi:SAM-dependent methyltransferase